VTQPIRIDTDEIPWTHPHYGEIYQVSPAFRDKALGRDVSISVKGCSPISGRVRMIEITPHSDYIGLALDVRSIFAAKPLPSLQDKDR
jgi:hypothetical protein